MLNRVDLLQQEVVVQEEVVDTFKEQQEVEIHLQLLHLKEIMEQIQLRAKVLHQVIRAVAAVEQLQLLFKHLIPLVQTITMEVQEQQLQLQQVQWHTLVVVEELIDVVVEQMILMVVLVVEEKVDMVQDQVQHLNQQDKMEQLTLVVEAEVVKNMDPAMLQFKTAEQVAQV
jgi:hypothetical protein